MAAPILAITSALQLTGKKKVDEYKHILNGHLLEAVDTISACLVCPEFNLVHTASCKGSQQMPSLFWVAMSRVLTEEKKWWPIDSYYPHESSQPHFTQEVV